MSALLLDPGYHQFEIICREKSNIYLVVNHSESQVKFIYGYEDILNSEELSYHKCTMISFPCFNLKMKFVKSTNFKMRESNLPLVPYAPPLCSFFPFLPPPIPFQKI